MIKLSLIFNKKFLLHFKKSSSVNKNLLLYETLFSVSTEEIARIDFFGYVFEII